KEAKQTARKMMQMMFTINQSNFAGHQEVTCYSCHHGGAKPVSVPIISEEIADASPKPATSVAPPADLPSADKLVEKYIQAIGGADALKKLSSRIEKGKATPAPGREYPIEFAYKSPDRGLSITHLPDGDLTSGYRGQTGWQLTPGRPSRELTATEIDA